MERERQLTAEEIADKEKAIRQSIVDIQNQQSQEHLYPKMQMEFHSWSYEERSITVRFPILKWELNHMGSMHGGLIAAAVDTVSGMASSQFSGCHINPTINISINYLLPALDGDAMLVTAKIDHLGKRLVNLTSTCRSETSGKTIATATVNFMLMRDKMAKNQ